MIRIIILIVLLFSCTTGAISWYFANNTQNSHASAPKSYNLPLTFNAIFVGGAYLSAVSMDSPALTSSKVRSKINRSIIDKSIPGANSSQVVESFDEQFKDFPSLESFATMVVISTGGSDSLAGISPKETLSNLEAIILKAKRQFPTARILIVQEPAIGVTSSFSQVPADLEALANKYGVYLAFGVWRDPLAASDPSEYGKEFAANAISEYIAMQSIPDKIISKPVHENIP